MTAKRSPPGDLRSRAEARLAARGVAADPEDALRLVHELRVHEIELELQNEELRETRAALEAALAQQIELFEFAPIGYFVVDAQGEVREANFAGARLLGLPRAEVIGSRFQSFVANVDGAAFDRFCAAVMTAPPEERPVRSLELSLLTADGAVLARVTAGLATGRELTVLLAVEDVTARRRAEDALHEELRRRDDFLGTLSHELRNPLAPIRNGLELLRRVGPAGGEARKALAVIERQAGHLTRIVDDLLDVTRIARGKLQLRRRVEDLGELVRRAAEDHRSGFEEGGIALELATPPESCWADVDPTRVAQIVGNLLANSLKFTGRGGRVVVALRPDGRELRLSIRDTGAGIAPEILERLFLPFSQGPQGLARTAGGLGLGLATARGLAELHGGTVDIASDGPGRGTEVVVRLPRAAAPLAPAGPAPRPVPGSHRVLVIDDNQDAASTLKEVLETCGHAVRTAHDAASGLAIAHEFEPDLVLCDIGLPGPDGYSVARALRADQRLCMAYLVALSGYARPEDVHRSVEAGFDRHLAKPASLDRLQALIAEAPAHTGAGS